MKRRRPIPTRIAFAASLVIVVACGLNCLMAMVCVRYAPRQEWLVLHSVEVDWPMGTPKALPSIVLEAHDAHSKYDVFDGRVRGSSGFGVDYFEITEHDIGRNVWSQTGAVTAGWPFRSLIGYSGFLGGAGDGTGVLLPLETWERGLLLRHEEYWIPMLPRLWALVGNTIVTAIMLATLITAPVAIRRRIRRRRGCCVCCGFQLSPDQARCPECGTQ